MPAPAVPVASPVPAATSGNLDGELALLKNENEALKTQLVTINEQMGGLLGQLETSRNARQAEIKPPTEEELDSLPRGEAIRRTVGPMLAGLQRQLMGALGGMSEDVVRSRDFLDESAVRERFPALVFEKYRQQFRQKRNENRRLTAIEVIKLVADPADLVAVQADTTVPRPQDRRFPVDSGVSGSGSRSAASGGDSSVTEAEIQSAIAKAREAGDVRQVERLTTELIKRRGDVPAQRR
jgi:hypothetical protein